MIKSSFARSIFFTMPSAATNSTPTPPISTSCSPTAFAATASAATTFAAEVILHCDKVRDFVQATFLGADAKQPMRIIMKKSKIEGRWTTWYLATNVFDSTKTTIISHYERRMGCEATFRDLKTTLGWRKQLQRKGFSNNKLERNSSHQ